MARTGSRLVVLVLASAALGLALTGCPTPPSELRQGSAVPGGAGGGGAPGGPPQGGAAGGGQPGGGQQGGGQPGGAPAGGGAGGSGDSITPPKFADIASDERIQVEVTIKGGTKGQIDFAVVDEMPKAVHVEPFDGPGPHRIEAPAVYGQPIYVGAVNYANGESMAPGDEMGQLAEPIELDGTPLKLTIEMGQMAEWPGFGPADGEAGEPPGPPPPSGAAPPPPGGAAPAAGGPKAPGAGAAPPVGTEGAPPQ